MIATDVGMIAVAKELAAALARLGDGSSIRFKLLSDTSCPILQIDSSKDDKKWDMENLLRVNVKEVDLEKILLELLIHIGRNTNEILSV